MAPRPGPLVTALTHDGVDRGDAANLHPAPDVVLRAARPLVLLVDAAEETPEEEEVPFGHALLAKVALSG